MLAAIVRAAKLARLATNYADWRVGGNGARVEPTDLDLLEEILILGRDAQSAIENLPQLLGAVIEYLSRTELRPTTPQRGTRNG